MNKKEFIEAYAKNGNFESKKAAEKAAEAFLETVENGLVAGDNINFIGWGKWEVVEKKARIGRNPKTGEEVPIAAKKAVKFSTGKGLADKVK